MVLLFPTVACSEEPTQTLLVLGDSLSAAYGIAPESGWVALLNQRLQDKNIAVTVVNHSKSGKTTAEGLSELPNLLESINPYWILIALGSNDGLRGYPVKDIHDNIKSMIEACQTLQMQVILAGFSVPPNYGSDYSNAFKSLFSDLAEEYHLPFIPFLLEGLAKNLNYFQSDNFHPNEAAQPIILENVWSVLEPLFKKQ